MKNKPIIECIPNFSEGQNATTINTLAREIEKVKAVQLLHIDQSKSANRSVFTFVGSPEKVIEAAFLAIKKASELIDMRTQRGAHPRIGATDVCPLVPIANIEMKEVIDYAKKLGERVAKELSIPIYLYEYAATSKERINLAAIRAGEYEGLEEKMKLDKWKPDFGATFNAKSGATVIGVRDFLIAFNVNLNTNSVEIARTIAREIRESGKVVKSATGKKTRIPGKYKALKAIGWYIEEYGKAQVSMNLTNIHTTTIHEAFEACKAEAVLLGIEVTGSELIGLIPLAALLQAGQFYYQKEKIASKKSEKDLIQMAVKHLGLAELAPFCPEKRVIEYLI